MSKKDFSKAIMSTMKDKALVLESSNPLKFFEYDETLEFVLCLAYMTLSKEKIIKKDIDNTDDLGRLTKMISTTDIDLLFKPSFNPEVPVITNPAVNNNLWILDNIRDSIMHGKFTVDLVNKKITIKNRLNEGKVLDRTLDAEIPFSWFIAYTKNDIFKKKVMDKYTVCGFFYDISKKDKKHFRNPQEIYNHIFYNAEVTGNKFNVNEIETRIKELFYQYKDLEIDDETYAKYKSRILEYPEIYRSEYLIRFLVVRKKVKEQIEKEYPGVTVNIRINARKEKLVKKLARNLDRNYKNYDLLFDELDLFQSHKSTTLINYLSNIITSLSSDKTGLNLDEMNPILFSEFVDGKKIEYPKVVDNYGRYRNNLDILKTLVLNALAISTLVINQEEVYETFFGSDSPHTYGIHVMQKKPLEDSLAEERKTRVEILEKSITLCEKKIQLSKIPLDRADKITLISTEITSLETELKDLEKHLCDDVLSIRYNNLCLKHNKKSNRILYEIDESLGKINELQQSFDTIVNEKGKVDKTARKELLTTFKAEFDKYAQLELSIKYWSVNNMRDAITVIRNSFSHIARSTVAKNYGTSTMFLNDYDTDNTKSGQVIASYGSLVHMLTQPLQEEISLKKTK